MADRAATLSFGSEELTERIHNGIVYFLSTLSPELREKMDFSQDALNTFTRWLLQHYEDEDDFLFDEDEPLVNGLVFYVGETFKKYLGGYWDVLPQDSKETFGIHFSNKVILRDFSKDMWCNPYEGVMVAIRHRFEGELSELKQTLNSWLNIKRLDEKYGEA